MTSSRSLHPLGLLLLLVGGLASPLKEFSLRCYSNPAHLLEGACDQFRHWHTPWGYAVMFAGLLLVGLGALLRRRHRSDVSGRSGADDVQ